MREKWGYWSTERPSATPFLPPFKLQSKCIKYTLMTPKLYPACRVQGKELMSVRAGRVSCFLLGAQNRRCYPGASMALEMVELSAVVTDLPETSVSLVSGESVDLVTRVRVPSNGFSSCIF